MSLLDAAERFASIDRSAIILDAKHCLHSRDQHSECAACYEICPENAIQAGEPPSLDAELCRSCLACLPACPVGAYHADDDVADLLNCAIHIDKQAVELLCGHHPHPESGVDSDSAGIKIGGCLAGLGTGAYLALSALGHKRILPRTDACNSCEWHSLSREISDQVERANQFLSAWSEVEPVVLVEGIEKPVERALWSAKNPPLSRRDLFRMVARQGQFAMARAMANGTSSEENKLGRDRLRLISAVSHLPEPSNHADLTGFGFATLTISDACTACGTCGKACPTQAIKFEADDNEMTFKIAFAAQNCIDCGICDRVCLPDAIKLNHAPSFEEVFGVKEARVVVSGPLVRCERCKTLTAKREGVNLCPLCEYRRTTPFGSIMPKKIVKESRS